MKKAVCLVLLPALLCAALCGCRTRVTVDARTDTAIPGDSAASGVLSPNGGEDAEKTEESEEDGEAGGQTKENPDARRKEYDESAPAEVVPGTPRTVYAQGEGTGAFADEENAPRSGVKLNEAADETAVWTVAAPDADRMGVSADAPEADSAMTYYTVLLRDRTESLYECQRLTVYWETARDHVTVHKSSVEHRLILDAGAYDVSARLLEENLRVDDGWIARKNPGVIVKAVERNVLGTGVLNAGAAEKAYAVLIGREALAQTDAVRNGRVLLISQELLEAPHLRTAAMLMIAKTADPALMADVDIDRALEALTAEETGGAPEGIYYYIRGGFR